MSTKKLDGVDSVMLTLFFIFFPFGVAWRGYAMTVLWEWFVMPIFGLRPLGLAEAVGLILFVGFLTTAMVPDRDKDKSTKDRCFSSIARMVFSPACAIAFAWPVKWFLA